MKLPDITTIKTADQAREYAIDWQNWQAEQSMSYEDMADWNSVFEQLAHQFNLTEEFEENGIL